MMPIKRVSRRDIIGGRLFCKNYTRICRIIQMGLAGSGGDVYIRTVEIDGYYPALRRFKSG